MARDIGAHEYIKCSVKTTQDAYAIFIKAIRIALVKLDHIPKSSKRHHCTFF